MIQQEYFCSFDIGTLGSIYNDQLQEAIKQNRVCAVPYDKLLEVDVILDLGRTDSTAICFRQELGQEVRFIDYEEGNLKAVEYYVELLQKKPYRYGTMYLPHDAFHKRMEAQKSIAEQFETAGFRVEKVEEHSIENGIQEVRRVFPRFWLDKEKCKQLIKALENYHREYDRDKKCFKQSPLHDWSSHACDSVRYTALTVDRNKPTPKEESYNRYNSEFDRFAGV